MKALIVDDCEMTRELLSLPILAFGVVQMAEDGEEAVKMVDEALKSEDPYTLVCLDLNMPKMGGHEALRRIRTLENEAGTERARVFMITSSSSPDDMVEALMSGECDDYLTKPVMTNTFKELLRKHDLIP